ncbi:MAG: galactosyldiacylglycerol synthase [Oscillochloris sp.]|nr:galactosyldiacylglycerol synthase [Oscillochloris sp.]
MPRVLLLHASVGTGHKRAAEALAVALSRRQPGEVRVEDVLDHTPRFFRRAYAGSYLDLTDRAPLVWGYFYTQTNADPNLAEMTNAIRKIVESIGTNGLKEVLRAFQPDVIICTHFLPMELLTRLRRNARLNQPIYCVITDFAAHTFWTYTDLDGYFVADEQTRQQLILRGVSANQIIVSGIPIDLSAAEPNDRDDARRRRNLPLDSAVITLFGGGVDNEHIRKVVLGLLRSDVRGILLVVAGRNEALAGTLQDVPSSECLQIRVHGFIDYVDDLIAASDIVITKAGGLIVSEVLARGTPLVVIDPIPGHEEWNADFVVSHGAGVQLRMCDTVPLAVRNLLARPTLLASMRQCAAEAGQPRAALTIADKIIADYDAHHHR